jgi:prepilin peptidase CpaA
VTATPIVACAVLYLAGLVLAAGWDLVTRTIPNILAVQVAAAASGMLLVAAPHNLFANAVVALAVLAGGALLFALKLWGAGDAKLLAAAALLLGAKGLPLLILNTALVGGVLAALWLAGRALPWRDKFSPQLPYGVAIACGAIIAFARAGMLAPLTGL